MSTIANKIHIVLITTWFPPLNGVAVNRMLSFVKYLDKSKFKISVITLSDTNRKYSSVIEGATIYYIPNNSILKNLKNEAGESRLVHNLKVVWNVLLSKIRTYSLENWVHSCQQLLNDLYNSDLFPIIISSYSPVEAHLAALEFCKKNKNVKWVVDMRDEFSLNPNLDNNQKIKYKGIEQEIENYAQAVTSVSEPILNDFKRLMPGIKYFEEIRNGFDHDLSYSYNFNDKFTIVYAGTFYGERKPDTFFEALMEIPFKNEIQFKFIGTHNNFYIPETIKSNCTFTGNLSYKETIQNIFNADASLLILPVLKQKGVYTGKIFDYLSAKKPIIAVVDKTDVAAKLILEANAGFIADFNNKDEIKKAVIAAYDLWKSKSKIQVNESLITSLHRKHQVMKLEQLILNLLEKK